MRTAAHPSDLEAAAQAMLAPVKTASRASAREALGRKCPRFVPSSEPILPFLDATGYARRIVEGLPSSVEVIEHPLADDGVYYEFRKARVAQAKRVAA